METPPPGRPSGPGRQDPEREAVQRQLAEQMEMAFVAAGRTLSDNETAAVYQRTLDLVQHMLTGATAQNIINEEQREDLTALVAGMREAPRYI
jgi:dsDNA-binding SOS-regulon protein